MQRRLAAIVIADVVGYSRLIGLDEAGTRERFRALSDELFTPSVTSHGGRIIKTMGDAFLVEFPSAVEAVTSAVEIQQAMVERESGIEPKKRLRFRIGINLGDIIVEGNDIHGEGVNIAARLESIARPGGICVSRNVYDEVHRKLGLQFSDGGEQNLKNIDYPVQVFHFGGEPKNPPPDGEEEEHREAHYTKPLIYVQPIRTTGKGDELSALAEGLREGIVTGFTAQSALAVTRDREAGRANFTLEGSVRASGSKVRANFSLYDKVKGVEVWAQRYDGNMEDLFELEDSISTSVVSLIRVRLKALEMEGLEATDNALLSVPQLLSKAAGYFVRSSGNNALAKEALSLALEKQPDNSMAHAMLAICEWRMQEHNPFALDPAAQDFIETHVNRARELEPTSYFALLVAALVEEDIYGDFRSGLDFAEQALTINPNMTQAQGAAGIAKCYLGRWQEGYGELCRAIAANRDDPHRYRHLRELALILLMEGRKREAADVMRRLIHQAPEMARNILVSAGIYWLAGEKNHARQSLAALLNRFPELTVANMREEHFIDDAGREAFREALIAAGLPEA